MNANNDGEASLREAARAVVRAYYGDTVDVLEEAMKRLSDSVGFKTGNEVATCSYCPESSTGTCDACDRPICEDHARHHEGDARAPEGSLCQRGDYGGCGT